MSKDVLDDLLKDDVDDDDDGDDNTDKNNNDALSSLKDEIEDLKKEKFGLLQDVKGERRKRQEFKSELDNLKGTVSTILEQNANRSSSDQNDDSAKSRIPVEYTDDGDSFLSSNKIDEILASRTQKYEEEINNLKRMLLDSTQQAQQNQAADRALQSLLGEDERFGKAYTEYQKARDWANEKVIDYQEKNNITGFMNSVQALEHVFDKNSEAEFEKQFPGYDLEAILLGGDSPRLLRRALSNISESFDNPASNQDDKFQKVLKKPSGLGQKANAKSNDDGITSSLGDISATDLLNLTDAQVKALEKALLDEEKSDGVKF